MRDVIRLLATAVIVLPLAACLFFERGMTILNGGGGFLILSAVSGILYTIWSDDYEKIGEDNEEEGEPESCSACGRDLAD